MGEEQGAFAFDDVATAISEKMIRRHPHVFGPESQRTSAEQTQGISQVGDAVAQLDQVTQQNAALVEESAAAADSLKEQAARLAQVVQAFRIDASSERTSGVVSSPAPGHKRAAMPTVPAARARQLPLVVNKAVVRSAPRSDAVSVAAPQRISAASPASKSRPNGKPSSRSTASVPAFSTPSSLSF